MFLIAQLTGVLTARLRLASIHIGAGRFARTWFTGDAAICLHRWPVKVTLDWWLPLDGRRRLRNKLPAAFPAAVFATAAATLAVVLVTGPEPDTAAWLAPAFAIAVLTLTELRTRQDFAGLATCAAKLAADYPGLTSELDLDYDRCYGTAAALLCGDELPPGLADKASNDYAEVAPWYSKAPASALYALSHLPRSPPRLAQATAQENPAGFLARVRLTVSSRAHSAGRSDDRQLTHPGLRRQPGKNP